VFFPFAFLLFSFFIFSLPFNIHFKPFVHGIGVVAGWEIADRLHLRQALEKLQPQVTPIPSDNGALTVLRVGPFLLEKGNSLRSPFWMLLVLWGFFYVQVILYIRSLFRKYGLKQTSISLWSLTFFFLFLASAAVAIFFNTFPLVTDSAALMSFFSLVGLVSCAAVLVIRLRIRLAPYIIALIFLSTLLLVFPEYFYVKDIYPAHYRANTMFKLGYQAYSMLSIVAAYVIMRIQPHHRVGRYAMRLIQLVMLFLVSIYSYFAIQSYYGVWNGMRSYEGIDGIKWLATERPDDYQAVTWLNQHVTATDDTGVTLEAVGDSYTDYGRISAHTGLPTILGWTVHEWLWRGSYDEPGTRVEEVRQIYEAETEDAARTLLQKYHVRYLVIGQLEREKYPKINEAVLTSLGTEVFRSGTTAIYQL
ncbi:hypothetical protein HY468_02780, partial [Candidatus Roizmanbacteria bacterium]|nr:hypothetical protein [Candidatus Roizmanbacteria bacterium]